MALDAQTLFFTSPETKPAECNEKDTHIRIAWRQCDTRDTVGTSFVRERRPTSQEAKIWVRDLPGSESRCKALPFARTDTTLDSSLKARELKRKEKRSYR